MEFVILVDGRCGTGREHRVVFIQRIDGHADRLQRQTAIAITGRDVDFWLVPEPKWLDAKYPEQAKRVGRPCVALVSTDATWITFMKLRLDRVLRIDLGAVEATEALAVGGEVPESFKKPEKWTAPYTPYSDGWWNVFMPK